MNKHILITSISLLISSVTIEDTLGKPAAIEEAKAITHQFGGSLRAKLIGAVS